MSKKKKVCNKCGEKKTLDLFYKNRNYKDGYDYYCKKCKIDYMLKSIKLHPTIERKSKVCTCCEKRLSVDNYFKFKYSYDGLSYACKKCSTAKSSDWRKKHIEHAKQYAKEYYHKNKHKKVPYYKTNKLNNNKWKLYYNDYVKKRKEDPENKFRLKVARLMGFYTNKYPKPKNCQCCNSKDKTFVVVPDVMLEKYLKSNERLKFTTIINEVEFWCRKCIYAKRDRNKNG